jgi:thiamine biosynthesis lipoprotein
LKDQSLATSKAGEPTSVTVIAPACTDANVWVTALSVLGERRGVTLADQHGIAALFLSRNGDEVVEVESKQWQRQ